MSIWQKTKDWLGIATKEDIAEIENKSKSLKKIAFKKLRITENTSSKIEPKVLHAGQAVQEKCFACPKKLFIINRYRCAYCLREHCDKHRLPEKHGCTGKLVNPHRESSIVRFG